MTLGSIHVSVPSMISALVLSIRFLTGPCFDLIDWKFTTRSLSGVCRGLCRLELSGVEAWTGRKLSVATGLCSDVSESTLKRFVEVVI